MDSKARSVEKGLTRGPQDVAEPVRSPHRRWGWPVVLVLVIVSGCVAVLGFTGWREMQDAKAVRQIISELKADGQPVDNPTLEIWFARHTWKEGTVVWHQILELVEAYANLNDLPTLDEPELPQLIDPGGDWPEEPAIGKYLREMAPLLAKLDEAGEFPMPIWQPVHFNGFWTLLEPLDSIRQLSRFAQMNVEYSAFHQDAGRTINGLQNLKTVAGAFDWQNCMVTELVHLALAETHLDAVCRAMSVDMFRENDIQVLVAQVDQPFDVQSRFRNVLSGERGLVLATLNNPELVHGFFDITQAGATFRLRLPSIQRTYLRAMAKCEQLADKGLPQFSRSAARFVAEISQSSNVALQLFAPYPYSFAVAHERYEFQRRLTRMALAVKAYYLRNGVWPTTPADLESVGLALADRHDIQGIPYLLLVDEDGVTVTGTWPESPTQTLNSAENDGVLRVRIANLSAKGMSRETAEE